MLIILSIVLVIFLAGALTIFLIAADHPRLVFACIGVYASLKYILDRF